MEVIGHVRLAATKAANVGVTIVVFLASVEVLRVAIEESVRHTEPNIDCSVDGDTMDK